MELCKISVLSHEYDRYKDIIFVVVNYDGNMANIKYRKNKDDQHFTSICVPKTDVVVIQMKR